VCIAETWLDDDISDTELFIRGYVTAKLDRSRHGGGIIMYIESVFSYNVLFTGDSIFECVIVSLKLDSCTFCVCLLYRPPSAHGMLATLFSTLTLMCSLAFS